MNCADVGIDLIGKGVILRLGIMVIQYNMDISVYLFNY